MALQTACWVGIAQIGWPMPSSDCTTAATSSRCWRSPRRRSSYDRTVAVDANDGPGQLLGFCEGQTCYLRSDLGPTPVQLGTLVVDSWRHRVDRHPVVAQCRGQCQRESEQPVLGRREVHPLGIACQCVAAEDVDDPSARDERRQRTPDTAEGAVEGDRTDLMPVLFRDRLDALPWTVRGVVDQDPQRAVRG